MVLMTTTTAAASQPRSRQRLRDVQAQESHNKHRGSPDDRQGAEGWLCVKMYKTALLRFFRHVFPKNEKSAVSYKARTSVHVPHTQLLNHVKTANGVSRSKTALFCFFLRMHGRRRRRRQYAYLSL
jgi:hypothetical protein